MGKLYSRQPRRQFPLKNTKKQGFTLPEIIIVLTILAIMTAIVTPQYTGRLQKERFDNALYQLQGDLRWAQSQAKSRGELVKVAFYPSAGRDSYRITALTTAQLLKSVMLPQGVTVNYYGTTEIIFQSNGAILQNGHFTLSSNGRKRYDYFYQTGRIRLTNVLRKNN